MSSCTSLNTRLAHDSEEARRKGAELIVERVPALVADGNLPMIVTADFNTRAIPMRRDWYESLPEPIRTRYDEAVRDYLWKTVVHDLFLETEPLSILHGHMRKATQASIAQ